MSSIDALAASTDQPRNDVVDQALSAYLEANAWQIARIEAGLAAARLAFDMYRRLSMLRA